MAKKTPVKKTAGRKKAARRELIDSGAFTLSEAIDETLAKLRTAA